MQYIPHASWLKLVLLAVPVISWGLWPLFRTNCGAPVLIFARINILSQFGTACVYALIFEGPLRIYDTFKNIDLRVGFALLGGFMLGHGDQCSAIPMKYLQPGITIALVSTINLVLTCIFNYIQVGAKRPDYVLTGLVFAFIAIILLSQTVKKSSREELREEMTPGIFKYGSEQLIPKKLNTTSTAGSTSSLFSPGGEVIGSAYLTFTKEAYMANPHPKLMMSKRKGLIIMGIAGLFTACWGPMSTYARNGSSDELVRSPGLMVFTFTLGEVFAIPDLYLICLLVEPQPEYILTWRRLFWGVFNGAAVTTGYFFFFTSTYDKMDEIVVPATVIVNCNALVAVLTDIIRGEFRGAPTKTEILLTASVTLYINAVLMNAFSV